MSIQEQRRPAFEQAVIERMKESGFLEVEIRVECLQRNGGDGYYDGSIQAYWEFWQAACDLQLEALATLADARGVLATALRTSAPDWFGTDEEIAKHHTIKRIDAVLTGKKP